MRHLVATLVTIGNFEAVEEPQVNGGILPNLSCLSHSLPPRLLMLLHPAMLFLGLRPLSSALHSAFPSVLPCALHFLTLACIFYRTTYALYTWTKLGNTLCLPSHIPRGTSHESQYRPLSTSLTAFLHIPQLSSFPNDAIFFLC